MTRRALDQPEEPSSRRRQTTLERGGYQAAAGRRLSAGPALLQPRRSPTPRNYAPQPSSRVPDSPSPTKLPDISGGRSSPEKRQQPAKDWQSVSGTRHKGIPGDETAGCRCYACRHVRRNNKDVFKRGAGKGSTGSIPLFRSGTRCILTGGRTGTIRWCGFLDSEFVQSQIYVGVHLDDRIGNHDGVIQKKRYFKCPPGHGVFVPKRDVLLIKERFDLAFRSADPFKDPEAPDPPVSFPPPRPTHSSLAVARLLTQPPA